MAEPDPKKRGKMLRRFRDDAGLTRERLAPAAGVSVSTLVRAEKGEPIGIDTAMRIASALGVSVTDLGYDQPTSAHEHQLAGAPPAWAVKLQEDLDEVLAIVRALEGHS